MTTGPERYARQVALKEIGTEGQAKIRASSVLVVGSGALGCMQAQLLARAGVGRLRLVDRDFVEVVNLHRQTLFDEDDARMTLPKAEAASRRLRKANSDVQVEAVVADVTARNIEALLDGVDVALDATDNFETRYLVNDACVKLGKPWVHGGAMGVSGNLMTIRPGVGPCLRCLFPKPPPPGSLPGCHIVGVLNTAPAIVASLQVTEALRLLVGDAPATCHLTAIDLWDPRLQRVEVKRDPDCICCVRHQYDFLCVAEALTATSLVGRNAVQVTPARAGSIALDVLARKLEAAGKVVNNGLLLSFRVGQHRARHLPGREGHRSRNPGPRRGSIALRAAHRGLKNARTIPGRPIAVDRGGRTGREPLVATDRRRRTVRGSHVAIVHGGRTVQEPLVAIDRSRRTSWEPLVAIDRSRRTSWEPVVAIDRKRRTSWEPVVAFDRRRRTTWEPPSAIDRQRRAVWCRRSRS